jgi:small subunit ribosomal protein S6
MSTAADSLKDYEIMYIVKPSLDDEAVDRVVAVVEEHIKSAGGTVENSDRKGRRRLAYEIDKIRDGFYVLTQFQAKPESITALKRMMILSDDIVKSLVVVREDEMVLA